MSTWRNVGRTAAGALLAALVVVCCGTHVSGADDTEPNTKTAALHALYRADAERYAFARTDDAGSALSFRRKPVMHWASDNDWSGDVFVWTHGGRPEVVGCILSGPADDGRRRVFHEFHTLAPLPLTMTESATSKTWSPGKGVTPRRLPDVPPPAANARVRLLQMRALARSFTARMLADDEEWTLRLLPQPIFRYGAETNGVLDGAIFAFVWGTGTDPEMLLSLEARPRGEESASDWTFLPIQFTNRRRTFLERNGEELWRTEVHSEPSGDSRKRYTIFSTRTTTLD